jgi:pimeloyl-ACP methyl ester carboxylesterase
VILAAKSKTLFRTAMQTMRAPVARKRAFDGLAHRDIDDLIEIWVRPALSDPAVAEDLRQFTLSLRTEVTTNVAARLPEFDKPTLVAWSADDTFFELGDGERLAAIIPNARLEVIDGARTFSMVDRPDRLADLLSTIAVRA